MPLRSWLVRGPRLNASVGSPAGPWRSAGWVAVLAALLLVGSPERASGQGAGVPGLQVLTAGSTYQEGCFPPCLCPLGAELPVSGTFTLQPAQGDPLFAVYDLTDAQWRFLSDGVETAVTGSGTYRVGGEVAVMQRLSLDLRVGSGPTRHFDSGLVVGGAAFPALDVVVSQNGMVCYDRVLRVHARPAPPLPQHAVFALVPEASSVELSLFTGGTGAHLHGTLRLLLGDPDGPPSLPAGTVALSVDGADLLAPDLEPELPGLGQALDLVQDPAVPSVGSWDLGSGEVALDLQLVGLPVPMPIHLRGKLDGSALAIGGDNGGVADGSITMNIRALRVALGSEAGGTLSAPR